MSGTAIAPWRERELADDLLNVLKLLVDGEEAAGKRIEHYHAQRSYRTGVREDHWRRVRLRIRAARRVLERMIYDLDAGRLAVVS